MVHCFLKLSFLSVILFISSTKAQSESPTHIVKFKSFVGRASAPAILLSHHRDFLSFVRKKNVSVNPLAQDLHLNRIDLGNNFNAVEGVFSDHAFLDYLYKQSTVEYVESNQVYKTTVVGSKQRRAEEEEEEDEGLEEDEDGLIDSGTDNQTISSTLKKGKPSNWGLARIHQRQRGDFEKYVFDSIGGAGIEVYVLDTGVYADHLDFGHRVIHSINLIMHEDENDMGGHGTHVAAKIAGTEYGVAKTATIRSVKVLNKLGDGSTSTLLKGIEHVIKSAKPGHSLINLSLSGPHSRLIDDALNEIVLNYNIPVFASAGNAGTDACFFTPSSNPNVFSVGAIDMEDRVPHYSDVGECAIRDLATKDVIYFDPEKSSSPNNNLPASHAGSWYTNDKKALDKELNLYIKKSVEEMTADGLQLPIKHVKAIIAPKRVFILGPSHVCATRECLLPNYDTYETPLGNLPVDWSVIEDLHKTGLFGLADSEDEINEHSIEMHLPFIYKAFEKTQKHCLSSRPISVTDKDHGIHLNRNNASSTIVRPIYESIQALDHQGIKAIESLSFDQFENYLNETDNTICGRNPIGVLLACLEEMKGDRSARCLKYAQSSKCRTLEDSSVSYASIYIQVVPEQ
ncbi:hypothetical protein RO3G_06063 [Rhizopus delemar RA 99-880]|uniref:Peptidase S8/S53 domain-containing protein n=1 Tax=Rhizopus delemar (strain RA 99-880 / ATCC MYA-4621 / FGSC 9543 / NRRL 43880) TaxID=246409 RepID=I1BYS8_RHIO9|nr:hypothetical protein RO3G_06063 [Rhizopus delemar RA 99-880]|eukprot:EIE81358.1 hypothetical protein RO3G_06063 [Rhizopus delemar RA 99-880]